MRELIKKLEEHQGALGDNIEEAKTDAAKLEINRGLKKIDSEDEAVVLAGILDILNGAGALAAYQAGAASVAREINVVGKNIKKEIKKRA